jgi:PAS domain-containing protein
MYSAASEEETSSWLVNEGSKELELLLWAVLSHQADPVLIADDSGRCVEASAGAGKLLGISTRKMVGESVESLLQPNNLQHSAAKEVLPGRHLLVLHDDSGQKNATADVQDYAFLSLDSESRIVAWHAGAERVYGYTRDENHRSTCQLPQFRGRRAAGRS